MLALNNLLDQVIKQTSVDVARIFLCDLKNKDLHFAVGCGFQSKYQNEVRYQYGDGLVGRVALKRRPLLIADLSDPRNATFRNGFIEMEEFILYFGMPLIFKGSLLGVLDLYCRQYVEVNRKWFEMISASVEKISAAIDSAEYYERILDFG